MNDVHNGIYLYVHKLMDFRKRAFRVVARREKSVALDGSLREIFKRSLRRSAAIKILGVSPACKYHVASLSRRSPSYF